eukprot:TRINITY_DN14425_c2_g1_i3.p1 TRINITY_DN14425_c2_g1~~TRINITY_DN14425_c2_g1_i3.p1  ORF type:complete len:101 (+),score=15.34 TRINITY_DN14425_c2_g1_i3:32-334(+)
MAVSSTSAKLDAMSNAIPYSELTRACRKGSQWQSARHLLIFTHQVHAVPTTVFAAVQPSVHLNRAVNGFSSTSVKLDAPGKGSAKYNLLQCSHGSQLYIC